MSRFLQLDDAQGLFFSNELKQIEAKMFEQKFPDLEAEKLLPSRIQVDPAFDSYEFRKMDMRGEAVALSGKEDGVPRVDFDADKSEEKLQEWGLGFSFSIFEIQKAARLGMNLSNLGAMAVRRGLAEKLNYMALLGMSSRGITGLFNQSGTTTASTTGTAWGSASSTNILDDMFAMVDTAPNNTYDIESPRVLLLPKTNLRIIEKKVRDSAADSTTVLEFFKKARPNVTIMGANYLDDAGTAGKPLAVAYDPAQVHWLVSVPFVALAPQEDGFNIKVNCYAKGGGVVTAYPKSITYGDLD